MALAFQELADAPRPPSAQSGRACFRGRTTPDTKGSSIRPPSAHSGRPCFGRRTAIDAEENLADDEQRMFELETPLFEKRVVRLPQIRRIRANKDPRFFPRSLDGLEDMGYSSETGRWEMRRAAKYPAETVRTLDEIPSVQGQAWEESLGNPKVTKTPVPPPGRPQKSQRLRALIAMRVATRSLDSNGASDSRTTAASDNHSDILSECEGCHFSEDDF